jgi:Spy/CpxP family protein refolding chaperone
MNPASKNKLLTWLVVLLLIANAATIATFWFSKTKHPPPPKGSPADYLIKELNFDAKQQEQFMLLVNEHRKAADEFRGKIKTAKDSFFDLLKQSNVTDSSKRSAAAAVSSNTEQLDLLTLEHFQKVRALCTPEQQKKFDNIIHQVTSMMAAPRPMGPGGPEGPGEGPEGDRPPPPRK